MSVFLSSRNSMTKPWYRANDTAQRNADARTAYESLMTVTLRKPTGSKYRHFSNEVKDRALRMYNFTYNEPEVKAVDYKFHVKDSDNHNAFLHYSANSI